MEDIDFSNWELWMVLLVSVVLVTWILRFLFTRAGASSLFSSMKKIYSGDHDYASVDPKHFNWMDLGYYDRMTKSLTERGFVHLEDLEDLTLTRTFPLMRTFVRSFSGAEGTIAVGVYDMKPRGWYRLLQKVGAIPSELNTIDLETELSDGRFVISTTADPKMASFDIPPEAHVGFSPRGTPLDDFIENHTERVQAELDRDAELDMVRIHTAQDCRAMQTRLQRLKNRFKQGRGYLTAEEIAQASNDPDSSQVKKLGKAVEKEKRSRGE